MLTILFPLSVIASQDSTWDLQGQVFHPTSIIANVVIKNAIIEASPYVQIFDTSTSLINCKTKEFSTAWFGASPKIADNSVQLQKCITICIGNQIANLWCADNYTYSQSLLACNVYNGIYVGFGLNFYGDGDRWNQKQTLTYTGNSFAFGVQVAKGGSFRGITLIGKNVGTGIVVDYDGSKNLSGSTGYFVENCFVGNFDINYDISPRGTWNGDILRFNSIHSGKCRIGIRSNSPQNKGNEINGFYSWDSCKEIAINIRAGNWIVRGGNIARFCEQILGVSLSGWNTFSVQGLFAESVKSLGYVYAQNSIYLPPVNLQDMDIQFIPGTQCLFTSNSTKVRISNSTLWFYNGLCCQKMWFQGAMLWDNNDCGQCELNANNQIQYIRPQSTLSYP